MQYRQTPEDTIVLNVRQTMIVLEQDRAAIDAAQEARVYAQQSYDDEVKRLQLGTSTAFTVIQKQQLLTAAQGVELRDRINLIEAELNSTRQWAEPWRFTTSAWLTPSGYNFQYAEYSRRPEPDAQAGHR